MDGRETDSAIFPECFLGPIAMVYVPIDVQHSIEIVLGEGGTSCDRDAIEQAKTHRIVRPRMVSGRPHQTQGRRFFACHVLAN
jgi:hypothetical protein